MVRPFSDIFYNSPIHKSFNNSVINLVHVLPEAEEDAEQASKTRRGTSFGIAPVPVPVQVVDRPYTQEAAYVIQLDVEIDAIEELIEEQKECM